MSRPLLHTVAVSITYGCSLRYYIRCILCYAPCRPFSGVYGDLGAAVYAMLTDREAREAVRCNHVYMQCTRNRGCNHMQ